MIYVLLVRLGVLPELSDLKQVHQKFGFFLTAVMLGMAIGAGWEIVEWSLDEWAGPNLVGTRDGHRHRPDLGHDGRDAERDHPDALEPRRPFAETPPGRSAREQAVRQLPDAPLRPSPSPRPSDAERRDGRDRQGGSGRRVERDRDRCSSGGGVGRPHRRSTAGRAGTRQSSPFPSREASTRDPSSAGRRGRGRSRRRSGTSSAPRRIAWTGTSFGIKAIHVHTLEPRNGGTLVRTEESYDGLVARLFRRRLQKDAGPHAPGRARAPEGRSGAAGRAGVGGAAMSRGASGAARARRTQRRETGLGRHAPAAERLRSVLVGWTARGRRPPDRGRAPAGPPRRRRPGRIRRRGRRRRPQRAHRSRHRSDPPAVHGPERVRGRPGPRRGRSLVRRRDWSATPSPSTRSAGRSRERSPRRPPRSRSRSRSASTTTTRTRCA